MGRPNALMIMMKVWPIGVPRPPFQTMPLMPRAGSCSLRAASIRAAVVRGGSTPACAKQIGAVHEQFGGRHDGNAELPPAEPSAGHGIAIDVVGLRRH